ncbi:LpqB family beta-propeller domain-containing protein [Kitasatospora sp. NPDC059327]|uniref:LpqB family beta-propeller domain-containing protein n=1 Tax=Kitasatospora sp. NPDC059327 TaxID=3346803 RepID=UPI0036D0F7B6
MRRTSRTEPRLAAVAGVVLGALLAGGCAAMPDSGGVSKVELAQDAVDKNLQVRVFPMAPPKGAKPRDLLAGFLDAVTADESYDTARMYLTDEAAAKWKPDARIQVLSATPSLPSQTVTEAESSFAAPVSGMVVAEVDAKHSYTFLDGQKDVDFQFAFVREKKSGEWRIDALPDGVLINETNFRISYRQVDRFFYAADDPSAPGTPVIGSPEVLIADPIYLRRRIDPLTSAAKAVVAGPSDWLAPVARTAFPPGSNVDRVSIDEARTAHVVLAGVDLGGTMLCKRMAAQLFYTLADQGKGQVDKVDLKGPRAGAGCQVARGDLPKTGPGALTGSAAQKQFFQRADNGVLVEAQETGDGSAVRGPLGRPQPNGKDPLGTIAVSRDGERAAAIGGKGHQLYLVPLADTGQAMPEPVLTTPVRSGQKDEDGLTSPSWDGRGDLWVVDRDPQNRRVVMVRGNRPPLTVPVDSPDGQVLQDLKISSDAVRIALVFKDARGAQSLWIGLVVHGGTREAPTARITGLRRVAPAIAEVSSVSWAEVDQLLVLGKEKGRLQQLHYISTDGSQSSEAPPQGGEGMASAQAAESRVDTMDQAPPVLARQGADGKIYRLVNSQWRELVLNFRASSFIYPG